MPWLPIRGTSLLACSFYFVLNNNYLKSPHDEDETFNFHDMLEYLLATSFMLYRGRKDLSLHDKGYAAYFGYFLKNDILGTVKGLRAVSDSMAQKRIYNVSFPPAHEWMT